MYWLYGWLDGAAFGLFVRPWSFLTFLISRHLFNNQQTTYHSHTNNRPYAAARLSQTVKDAQPCEDDDGESEDPEDVEIVKVDSPCLEKVVEFLKHYDDEALKEIKTPLEDNTFDGVVTQQWYRDFVKGVDQPMLFDLVTAANFMAIREFSLFFILAAELCAT